MTNVERARAFIASGAIFARDWTDRDEEEATQAIAALLDDALAGIPKGAFRELMDRAQAKGADMGIWIAALNRRDDDTGKWSCAMRDKKGERIAYGTGRSGEEALRNAVAELEADGT